LNPATAAKYGIMPIPTADVVQEWRACWRQIGGAPKQKQEQEQWITALV